MKLSDPVNVTLRFRLTSDDHHPAKDLIGYPTCKVKTDGNPFLLSERTIEVTDILHFGSRSTLYLGHLPDKSKHEVILKFAPGKIVVDEAHAYDEHEQIQGTVIPQLYGVLIGPVQKGSAPLACLVLERFGDRLETSFEKLDSNAKATILDTLVAAHKAGLDHLDFVENHVLVKNGQYRIADLSYVKKHEGTCTWNYKFAEHVGEDTQPEDRDSGCETIWRAALEMLFWNANRLCLCGRYYVKKSEDLPSQEQVDRMATRIGISAVTLYQRDDLMELALRYYRTVKTRLVAGQSLESLSLQRRQIALEVDKAWHRENQIRFASLSPEEND
ncbi:hypothetical protein EIP91_008331 [Steccherinum ochraceum]|uniref:Protein kinase domain-containing protein n=1 Tax=Steccherinum ochraceum TaxID=92696 RepID=A0A4R0RYB1_9APHY|nr:hypothetical protein EIP91_008331 [Steccherinum ochraceum]